MGKKARLKNLRIEELSQVDRGANQHADVVLMKRDANASTEDQGMTPEELAKKLEDLEGEVNTLKADKESLTTQRDEALAKAGMSDAEKAYMDGMKMDEKARAAFMSMEPDDRQKQMKEKPMSKADTGELPEDVSKRLEDIEKRYQEELTKRDEEIAKAHAKLEMAELTKRAETEYPNIPGEPIKKAQVLKAIDAMDEEPREMLKGILKTHNDDIGKAMKEVGKSGGADTTASDELDNLAKKYQGEHSVDFAKAYSEVLKTAEGQKLYEQSLSH